MPRLKNKVKILIVDDHPMIREGLVSVLSREPDFEVCGQADDIPEALKLVEETSPDLAIVDISLKTGNGIDLIQRIKARNNSVQILISSLYDEMIYAERALRAGAMGYVSKQEPAQQIVAAIRQILAGRIYTSERVGDQLQQLALGRQQRNGKSPIESLSNRELEVYTLIGQGLQTTEIADQLRLSVKTVETHRQRIKRKLGLTSTTELFRSAVQWVLENH